MILHIMILDKFIPPFIEFVDEYFGRKEHKYIFINDEEYKFGLEKKHDVEFLNSNDDIFIILLEYMNKANKIILHGLWRDRIDVLLYFNRELLKKCYWIMWGGDFYFPETKSKIRHEIIKNMGYIVSGTTEDYKLSQKWYGVRGKHIKCFNYPSNLYKDCSITLKENDIINIQLGNSATETNHHIEVLESLSTYKDENIKIFTPLSYGNKEYAKEVIEYGKDVFGDKFIALTEFMPFEEYLEFLSQIDIAIFNHRRQQAFGNIISLVGMGKKVYLNSESTLNGVMSEYGLKVFDSLNISLDLLDEQIKSNNVTITKENFSKEKLINSLKQYL